MRVTGFIGTVIETTIILLSMASLRVGRTHASQATYCVSQVGSLKPLYDDNKMINSEYESNSHKVIRLFIVRTCSWEHK